MKNKNPKRKTTKKGIKLPVNTEIRALIFVSNDKEPDVVTIKKYTNEYFHYKNKSYHIDFENVIFFKRRKLLFGSILYLFYHYNNDRPLCLSEDMNALSQKRLPNEVIYTALKSDAIKKAHDIKDGGFLQDNMMYIMIAGAIIVALYFMFGG